MQHSFLQKLQFLFKQLRNKRGIVLLLSCISLIMFPSIKETNQRLWETEAPNYNYMTYLPITVSLQKEPPSQLSLTIWDTLVLILYMILLFLDFIIWGAIKDSICLKMM